MVKVFNGKVSEKDAEIAWGRYSESLACNWCKISENMTDEDVLKTVFDYLPKRYAIIRMNPISEILKERFLTMDDAVKYIETSGKLNYFVAKEV